VALCDPDGTPILSLSVDYLTRGDEGLQQILPRQLQESARRIERVIRAAGADAES